MSDPFPGLIFLAIGGSVAPPLLLLTIVFLGSQRSLPNAGALALMLELMVFATPVLALIGLYSAVPNRASTTLGASQTWMGNNNRAITVVIWLVFGAFFLVRGLLGAQEHG
jgi:hypothetical protein